MWSSKLWGVLLFSGFFSLLALARGGPLVGAAIYAGIVVDVEGLAISMVLRRWTSDVPSIVHAVTCAEPERGSERPAGPAFRHANHLISSSNDDERTPAGAISGCLRPGSGRAARRTGEDRGAAAAGDSSRRAWRSQQFAAARTGLARTGQSGWPPSRRSSGRWLPRPIFPWPAPTSRAPIAAMVVWNSPESSCSACSKLAPQLDLAWLAYGDVLVDLEKYPDAKVAFERARLTDPHRLRIEEAGAALVAEDRKKAELIFRDILKADASHVAALCGLAAVSLAASRGGDALRLLHHALKQSAHLPLAWRGLCQAYVDFGRLPEAEAAVRHLLKIEAENPKNWVLLGKVYTRLMRQPEALVAFEEAARLNPGEVRLRLSIGHLHKTLGQRARVRAGLQGCLEIDPSFAEAYWSLADLKNYVFSDAEIAGHAGAAEGRRRRRCRPGATAFRARARFRAQKGLRRPPSPTTRPAMPGAARPFPSTSRYSKTRLGACASASMRLFSRTRAGAGLPDRAPIFVVGLPRSGSTLVEQILASHSSVEGTFELPNVLTIVREFDHANPQHDAYPESVRTVPAGAIRSSRPPLFGGNRPHPQRAAALHRQNAEQLQSCGPDPRHAAAGHRSSMCAATRWIPASAPTSSISRKASPSATTSRISAAITAATCSSWTTGTRCCRARCCICRYEELVRDPETNIRRLLTHCGLDFEPACLAFHETKRSVRTASAEQVRQPLYTSGVGYWRNFEPQLEPLTARLGRLPGAIRGRRITPSIPVERSIRGVSRNH